MLNKIKAIFNRKKSRSLNTTVYPLHFDEEIFLLSDAEQIFDKIVDRIYGVVEYDDILDVPDPKIRSVLYLLAMHYQVENGA